MPNHLTLGTDQLMHYFVEHLNRIYYAKLHMAENLPRLAAFADFSDLRHAITEAHEDIQAQLKRMDEIYRILGATYSGENLKSIAGLIDDTFAAVNQHRTEPQLRDLSILFYMQNIESVEVASFKVLQLAAVQLNNPQISQLLQENFDEAREDHALLLMINARYFKG